ncbi:antithrombin-III-like [Sabethes cyaneus]|uniref:antithrombin-III-like n=1 Tax=Sabethes cyaneus TaxID=53552 RepID=UPI00237D5522|nr:antithrombin-III-like [Sabethes cyaneus]
MLSLFKFVVLLVVARIAVSVENDFSAGSLDFTVRFFKNFYNQSTNAVVSPLSARLALAAIYQAAGSQLGSEIQRALDLPVDLSKEKTAKTVRTLLEQLNNENLHVLFKIFKINDPLEANFENAVRSLFSTEVETVNFQDTLALSKTINEWVSNSTNQIIRDFVEEQSLEPNTEFLLINVVALKAQWASRFTPDATRRVVFHFANGDREVDMMHQRMMVPYRVTESFHAAELAYSPESDLSMWIIIPRGRGSLGDLVRMLSTDMIANIRQGSKTILLTVELPRFSIRNEFDVRSVLERMGHSSLFEVADLEVFAGRRSEISEIFQSAAIVVDEEGTEATAATRVNVKWRSWARPFLAHKPFIFFIQQRSTNAILFIGQYSNHEE